VTQGQKSDWGLLLGHIDTPELNAPRTDFTHFHFQHHGRPQGGGKTGIYGPPLEIGTKKEKFLENVKSAV